MAVALAALVCHHARMAMISTPVGTMAKGKGLLLKGCGCLIAFWLVGGFGVMMMSSMWALL